MRRRYPRAPEGPYAPPRIPAVIESPEVAIGAIPDNQFEEARRLIRVSGSAR